MSESNKLISKYYKLNDEVKTLQRYSDIARDEIENRENNDRIIELQNDLIEIINKINKVKVEMDNIKKELHKKGIQIPKTSKYQPEKSKKRKHSPESSNSFQNLTDAEYKKLFDNVDGTLNNKKSKKNNDKNLNIDNFNLDLFQGGAKRKRRLTKKKNHRMKYKACK